MKKVYQEIIHQLNKKQMDSRLIADIARTCCYLILAGRHSNIDLMLLKLVRSVMLSFFGSAERLKALIMTNIAEFYSFCWWLAFLKRYFPSEQLTEDFEETCQRFFHSSLFLSAEHLPEEERVIEFILGKRHLPSTYLSELLENGEQDFLLKLAPSDANSMEMAIFLNGDKGSSSIAEILFWQAYHSENMKSLLFYGSFLGWKLPKMIEGCKEEWSLSNEVGWLLLKGFDRNEK